jgi:hypothetical protein
LDVARGLLFGISPVSHRQLLEIPSEFAALPNSSAVFSGTVSGDTSVQELQLDHFNGTILAHKKNSNKISNYFICVRLGIQLYR